jgi:methyltransferase (TIGR00027 family)
VDDPPFQAWKQQRIAALQVQMPRQLRFVPCDFESTSLADALAACGFREQAPCFVSWLGVTQYLSRDAIRATLAWAGRRASGSELVLTFLESSAQTERLKASMAETGTAVLSHFMPDEVTSLLREAGFSRIEHLSPAAANERYFQNRTDGLRAPEMQRLVSAIV